MNNFANNMPIAQAIRKPKPILFPLKYQPNPMQGYLTRK